MDWAAKSSASQGHDGNVGGGNAGRNRILKKAGGINVRGYSDHAANERTFLAWVRTGIAVIAFGFVVEKFNLFLRTIAGFSRAIAGGEYPSSNCPGRWAVTTASRSSWSASH